MSLLLFAPGSLTLEYLAGRRARYLRPLQVYLTASVIVFAAVQLFGLGLSLRFVGDAGSICCATRRRTRAGPTASPSSS